MSAATHAPIVKGAKVKVDGYDGEAVVLEVKVVSGYKGPCEVAKVQLPYETVTLSTTLMKRVG